MDKKSTRRQQFYGERNEVRILSQIVDAIVEAAGELQTASAEDWSSILVDSCRRKKRIAEAAPAVC